MLYTDEIGEVWRMYYNACSEGHTMMSFPGYMKLVWPKITPLTFLNKMSGKN